MILKNQKYDLRMLGGLLMKDAYSKAECRCGAMLRDQFPPSIAYVLIMLDTRDGQCQLVSNAKPEYVQFILDTQHRSMKEKRNGSSLIIPPDSGALIG